MGWNGSGFSLSFGLRFQYGLGLGLSFFMAGCGTLGYLGQAAKGQLAIIHHARPIADVLRDPRTPPRIAKLLAEIPAIKAFGESRGIKATSNYQEYTKLDRDAASYVVAASEKLQFKAKVFSFPIVGSFNYLGWFNVEDAKKQAQELKAEGWDVDVRGASAYSTLGWFKDPVLSTMISDGPEALADLVNVVIHESVHATLYIGGQSTFNESLASFVADLLTPEYLKAKADPDSLKSLDAYIRDEIEGTRRRELLHALSARLEALYASGQPDAEKLKLKHDWTTETAKQLGFKRELNNAVLIQFRTYQTGDQGFKDLLARCHGDLREFFKRLGTLREKSFASEQAEEFSAVLGRL